MTYEAPTTEEIRRVAEYWQRVKLITCEHKTGMTYDSIHAGPTCTDCGEEIRFLTDIQLEQRRRAPEDPTVREGLLDQMKRGGVVFAIDGEWHDVRFHAHLVGSTDIECVCIEVENVELLLRATESRR